MLCYRLVLKPLTNISSIIDVIFQQGIHGIIAFPQILYDLSYTSSTCSDMPGCTLMWEVNILQTAMF